MGNNVKYRSGDYTVATPIGVLRSESPLLPFNNEALVFHQDFVIRRDLWIAQDFNTPISLDVLGLPEAYLINESERADFTGNCVRWTRSWARVPVSYDMPGGIYQYQFPGFATSNGRQPIVLPVALTIRRTFFLCGNFGPGAGGFSEWQDIPINRGFRVFSSGLAVEPAILSDTVPTNPTLSDYLSKVNGGEMIQIEDSKIVPWRGSIFVRDDYLAAAQ